MAPATLRPARRRGGGPPITCSETRAPVEPEAARGSAEPAGRLDRAVRARAGPPRPPPRRAASNSAACRAEAAVSGRPTTASWRNRSMSCLTLRTKSPGASSARSRTRSSRWPRAQRQATSANPSSGSTCARQARRLLLGSQHCSATSRTAVSRGRSAFGGDEITGRPRPVAVSKVHAETTAASSGGSSPSKRPSAQRLGHEEVGLVVDPRQDGAARRQSPGGEVHVAEVLEQSESAVEAARQGVVMARCRGTGRRTGPR